MSWIKNQGFTLPQTAGGDWPGAWCPATFFPVHTQRGPSCYFESEADSVGPGWRAEAVSTHEKVPIASFQSQIVSVGQSGQSAIIFSEEQHKPI